MIFDNKLQLKWFIPHISENKFMSNIELAIGNVDNDPQQELIIYITNSFRTYFGMVVVDGKTKEHTTIDFNNYPVEGLELYDINNDGKQEVFIGRVNGIDVWDIEHKNIIKQYEIEKDNGYFPLVQNVKFFDFDGDKKPEIVTTHEGMIKILGLDSQAVLWKSRFLGSIQ
jgi:hypothetical protein